MTAEAHKARVRGGLRAFLSFSKGYELTVTLSSTIRNVVGKEAKCHSRSCEDVGEVRKRRGTFHRVVPTKWGMWPPVMLSALMSRVPV